MGVVEVSSFLRANEAGADYFWVLRHETRTISSPEAVFVTHSWPGLFTHHQSIRYASRAQFGKTPLLCGLLLVWAEKEAWEVGRGQRAEGRGQEEDPSFHALTSS